MALFSFAVAIGKVIGLPLEQQRDFKQLLGDIDDTIIPDEGFIRPFSSNSCQALATEDWLGIVNILIQRPRIRIWFTALKDCDPPQTCITASVLPCEGRTAPSLKGIQSICAFITALIAPCRSGELHTIPSHHLTSSRSSVTFGCVSGASSGRGKPEGLNSLTSAPIAVSRRPASSAAKRL